MPLTSAGPAMSYPARSGTVSTSSRHRSRSLAALASFSRSGWLRRTATISPSLVLSSQSGPFPPTATSCLSSASSSRSVQSRVGTLHEDLLRGLFHRSGMLPQRQGRAERLQEPFNRSVTFVRTPLQLPPFQAWCRRLAPFRRLVTRSRQPLPDSFSQSDLFRLSWAPWPSFAGSFSRSDQFLEQGLSGRRFAASFVQLARAKWLLLMDRQWLSAVLELKFNPLDRW